MKRKKTSHNLQLYNTYTTSIMRMPGVENLMILEATNHFQVFLKSSKQHLLQS